MHKEIENKLLNSYQMVYQNLGAPNWAVKKETDKEAIIPSIPFVGKNYVSSPLKIAVFASAENLTYYESSTGYYLLETEKAWNRHRLSFEMWLKDEDQSFFPKVHIAPVENGGLLCAVLFLYKIYGVEWNGYPKELLE